MGKGKKRNTAKVGNKGQVKAPVGKGKSKSNSNSIYTNTDQYHNENDDNFIKLTQNQEGRDNIHDDDGHANTEAVLDLGGGETSSSEDDTDDEDVVSEDEDTDKLQKEDKVLSSDDDSQMEEENEDVRDWGTKKKSLYGGDTADLEIGQDEDDAYVEEAAAKEVQAARYDDMEEQDFMLSDNDSAEEKEETVASSIQPSKLKWKRLSRSAKRKFIQCHHPELLPLLTYFSDVVQDRNKKTKVLLEAIFSKDGTFSEDLGTTKKGLEYLLTKSLVQTSTALNVSSYLLLKAEQISKKRNDSNTINDEVGTDIKSHPVMARLQQLNKLNNKLEDEVESRTQTLPDQMDKLIKAASLLKEGDMEQYESDSSDSTASEEIISDKDDEAEEDITMDISKHKTHVIQEEKSESSHNILNEVRFGLRPQEIRTSGKNKSTRRKSDALDFGDEDNDPRSQEASKSLASTINTIQQKLSTKTDTKVTTEQLDEAAERKNIQNGLDMMEAELGESSGDDNNNDENDNDNEEVEDGFYDRVKKNAHARKASRKDLYQVAPKYPNPEKVEVSGERQISKVILKNRGLVPHKAKINRNPRVKKREQYRKALIRRKGTVQEIRTDEVHKYGGETTGIKTRISRSRKL